MSESILSMKRECEVCHVVYERRSGEAAGASILWLSILPFLALVVFFAIDLSNPGISPWISGGIPMAIMLVIGIVFYRNVRGFWITISYLTGGVYADEVKSES